MIFHLSEKWLHCDSFSLHYALLAAKVSNTNTLQTSLFQLLSVQRIFFKKVSSSFPISYFSLPHHFLVTSDDEKRTHWKSHPHTTNIWEERTFSLHGISTDFSLLPTPAVHGHPSEDISRMALWQCAKAGTGVGKLCRQHMFPDTLANTLIFLKLLLFLLENIFSSIRIIFGL